MKRESDEMSDSEAESYTSNNKSLLIKAENRIEEKSSRGREFAHVSIPGRRKLSSGSPKNARQTNEHGQSNNFDDVDARGKNSKAGRHANSKQDNFSFDETDDSITRTRTRSAARPKKSPFDGWDAETIVGSDQKRSMHEYYSNDESDENSKITKGNDDDPSQDYGKKFSNRCEPVVKEELILSNDEKEEPEEFDNRGDQNERGISKCEDSGRDSDSDIPLSQFRSSQQEDIENNDKVKKPVKISDKSSPAKNSEKIKSNGETKKSPPYDLKFGDEKRTDRKSPLRITKTEIVAEKYDRNNRRTVESKNEFPNDEGRSANENNYVSNKKTSKGNDSSEDSISYRAFSGNDGDESRAEQIPGKQKHSAKNTQSLSNKLQTNRSLEKEKQSPKKKQSPLRANRMLKADKLGDDSGVEAGEKLNKKAAIKRTLKSLLNDESTITKPNIYDDDETSEEENKRVERKEVSKNFILSLKKPTNPNKKSLNSKGRQMVLVMKNNDQISKNNPPIESQSVIPSKSSIPDNKNTGSLSGDDFSDDAASGSMTEKLSENGSRCPNGILNDTEPTIRAARTDGRQNTSESAATSSSKILDSEDNSERTKDEDGKKTPLKRKHSESNFENKESNKRAKSSSMSKESTHAISDSDDTDPLTKLNTTLNKSMALMENDVGSTRSNKSCKSVSISTKYKTKTIATTNNVRIRKSILKKMEQVVSPDKEENIERNVQPINVQPKIIQRPLNFRDLEQQDTLICDTSTKASFTLNDLSSDDEIYIIEVPKTIDPRELKGRTIRLAGKSKLQIGDQSYETCDKDVPNISCIFRTDRNDSLCQTVNIKPAGCINIRQKLSKSFDIELPRVEKMTVPFPKNLKTRHPLFGADYEDKIKIKERKVSKNIATSQWRTKPISIRKSDETSNDDIAEIFDESKTERRLKKRKKPKEHSESEIDGQTDQEKTAQIFRNYSSDSDSYEGFFQTVKKRGKMKKHKKTNYEQNLLTDSNIHEIPLMRDLPNHLEDTTEANQDQELSTVKKLESSFNPSVVRLEHVRKSLENDQFSSSTPNKVEKNRMNDEGEVSTNIFGKRRQDKKKR